MGDLTTTPTPALQRDMLFSIPWGGENYQACSKALLPGGELCHPSLYPQAQGGWRGTLVSHRHALCLWVCLTAFACFSISLLHFGDFLPVVHVP